MDHSVFVVVLNYNGYDDTMECVGSMQRSISPETIDYQIVVVDNHSTDESFDRLQKTLPADVVLLQSSRNAGYAYGNNVGIRYAMEHGAEYVCILNNDTVITEDFLTPCIDILKKEEKTAFVGPMLMNYHNDLVQNTGASLSLVKGRCHFLNKDIPENLISEDVIECDIVIGAAMLFRSSLIRTIGLIPENYFLFYEETEWCWQARRAGFVNCVTTKARVIHKESESMKSMSQMQRYLRERNRTLFVKRNGSPLQFFAFLVFNVGRLLYRKAVHKIPLRQYLKYCYDGIVERFDPRFVKIRED